MAVHYIHIKYIFDGAEVIHDSLFALSPSHQITWIRKRSRQNEKWTENHLGIFEFKILLRNKNRLSVFALRNDLFLLFHIHENE